MLWRRPTLTSVATNHETPLNTPISDLSFTVFDTETTGFAVGAHDRMIEIGAVHVRSNHVQEAETFQMHVNPQRTIPPEITDLTGISLETVEHAPDSLEAIKTFLDFTKKANSTIWVGHYVSFDLLVIKKELQRHQHRIEMPTTIDTLDLIGYLSPSRHMHDLETYASQFGTRIYNRHEALGDALTTAHLFCELLYHIENRGKRTFAELLEISDMSKRNIQF
ncbi:3'-5' exonuclease [Alkalihalobacillus sp. MEB130]|uniref:3'-5' exonuclease n=1 Tax=Alkalihalobacillus sp. MEB130 TaxID=2976704 RepID=UPI0028DFC950|nr:3'-5' exonuclease [Alkalihalobacillus sp. MEB130]MDT8860418.1 3'-5' exonuclease [Alkalihalobacillus sp. MEB130]